MPLLGIQSSLTGPEMVSSCEFLELSLDAVGTAGRDVQYTWSLHAVEGAEYSEPLVQQLRDLYNWANAKALVQIKDKFQEFETLQTSYESVIRRGQPQLLDAAFQSCPKHFKFNKFV